MFELSKIIEEVVFLDFETVKAYENNRDNMGYFLDTMDDNENVIENSYFSINQKYHRTFEDDPSDVIDFSLIMDDISSKCFDINGRIRPLIGIVDAYDDKEDSNLEFVPKFRYAITSNQWNSHQYYFTIELPNPAIDLQKYLKFRGLIVTYIQDELESFGYQA